MLTVPLTSVGQTSCSNLRQIIPSSRKVYMIGEVHLDQEIPIRENVEMIKKFTEAEDSIREYLVQNCGVNHFLLELPNCYGYSIRQYMVTGDTGWIESMQQNTYQYQRILNLRKLNEKYENIRVSCVDVNYPKDANKTIFSLLTLTFYDHYSVAYYPPYNKVTAIPPSADLNVAMQIMNSDTVNITYNLRKYFIELMKLAIEGDASADAFNELLVKTKADHELMQSMEKFYGDGWAEVKIIMDSYLFGFRYKTINNQMLTDREPELYKSISSMMDHFKNDTFCMQFGDVHLNPDLQNNMVRRRIMDNYQYQPFCLHLIPQTFGIRLQQINKPEKLYDFNFRNKYCTYSTAESDLNVLIK